MHSETLLEARDKLVSEARQERADTSKNEEEEALRTVWRR